MNAGQYLFSPNYYIRVSTRKIKGKLSSGYVAFFLSEVIGHAESYHDARIIAANHCYDRAVARGCQHIFISPVEPFEVLGHPVPITLQRVYKAEIEEATRRRVVYVEDAILRSGEYYVCK